MTKLEALNLNDVSLEPLGYSIPRRAFYGMYRLRSFVFPSKIRKIESEAFNTTGLSGNLYIPEGITHIGDNAFGGTEDEVLNNTAFTGSLILPSTLKSIGRNAFNGCTFTGQLLLPEVIEHI